MTVTREDDTVVGDTSVGDTAVRDAAVADAVAADAADEAPGEPETAAPADAGSKRVRWRWGRGRVEGVPTKEEAAAAAAAAGSAGQQPEDPQRRVRLVVSRVDPWSVMKLAFLLSVGIGVALVFATIVVWNVLNTMGVFTGADDLLRDIAGSESVFDILGYAEFSRVVSLSVVVAVVDVLILTALATLFAFLYNVTAALVGGLHVTLTDE